MALPPTRDNEGYLVLPTTRDLSSIPSSPTLVLVSDKPQLSVDSRDNAWTTALDFVIDLQERFGQLLVSVLRSHSIKLLLRTVVFPFLSGAFSGWTTHLRKRILWNQRLLRGTNSTRTAGLAVAGNLVPRADTTHHIQEAVGVSVGVDQ